MPRSSQIPDVPHPVPISTTARAPIAAAMNRSAAPVPGVCGDGKTRRPADAGGRAGGGKGQRPARGGRRRRIIVTRAGAVPPAPAAPETGPDGDGWTPPSWEQVVRDHTARVYRL